MNCSRPKCESPAHQNGLCFAHESARLIEVCADAMVAKKVTHATVGGISLTLHPAAFLLDTEEPEAAPRAPLKPGQKDPDAEDVDDATGVRELLARGG